MYSWKFKQHGMTCINNWVCSKQHLGRLRKESSSRMRSAFLFNLISSFSLGNKPTLQPLRIPVTEQLASGLRDRTQAEKKQKEELKKITLSINERQVEEEQHQIDMALYSKQPTANTNRDKRPKYTPPKGAPDANLIFSSGGRRK